MESVKIDKTQKKEKKNAAKKEIIKSSKKKIATNEKKVVRQDKSPKNKRDAANQGVKRKLVDSDDDFESQPAKKSRKQVASDDDFESPPTKRSKRGTQMPLKKRPFIEFTNNTLHLRCDPGNLLAATRNLSDEQKKAVTEMGFGSLISLDISKIPSRLSLWLLQNYNEDKNEINIGNDIIKITPSLVHECLGIPMGDIEVLEKNKPRKGICPRLDEFKNQFDNSRISVIKVIEKVKNMSSSGRVFKTNFLVIFNTLLGEATKCTTVNQKFINWITSDDEIPKMNWCRYIMRCLSRTKKGWKGGKDQYTGPALFLAV